MFCPKAYISFSPFISDFVDKISPFAQNKICLVFKKLDTGSVCILEGMHVGNIVKSIFLGAVYSPVLIWTSFWFNKKHNNIIRIWQGFIYKVVRTGLWMEFDSNSIQSPVCDDYDFQAQIQLQIYLGWHFLANISTNILGLILLGKKNMNIFWLHFLTKHNYEYIWVYQK